MLDIGSWILDTLRGNSMSDSSCVMHIVTSRQYVRAGVPSLLGLRHGSGISRGPLSLHSLDSVILLLRVAGAPALLWSGSEAMV